LGIDHAPFPDKQIFGNLEEGTLMQRKNVLNGIIMFEPV